jgi:hypothetical protein
MLATAVDFVVTAAVEAPISSGTPATIRSLLSAAALAAIGTARIAQVDVASDTIDIHVRDSADTEDRADDYCVAPVTIAAGEGLGVFLISSGAAAKARLLIHCQRN